MTEWTRLVATFLHFHRCCWFLEAAAGTSSPASRLVRRKVAAPERTVQATVRDISVWPLPHSLSSPLSSLWLQQLSQDCSLPVTRRGKARSSLAQSVRPAASRLVRTTTTTSLPLLLLLRLLLLLSTLSRVSPTSDWPEQPLSNLFSLRTINIEYK